MKNVQTIERIKDLYLEHKGMADSPMIAADMRAESEFSTIAENRVARHMRTMRLGCKTTKKFVVTTDSRHDQPIAPNILNRNFSVSRPNTVWVSDNKVGSK